MDADAKTRGLISRAGADYVPPADLVDGLMTALDRREVPSGDRSAVQPTLRARRAAEREKSRAGRIVLLVAAALGTIGAIALVRAPEPAAPIAPARVIDVTNALAAPWPPAEGGLLICAATCREGHDGAALAPGDRLRTDATTRARIALPDGNRVVLEHDTEVELVGGSTRLVRGVLSSDVPVSFARTRHDAHDTHPSVRTARRN